MTTTQHLMERYEGNRLIRGLIQLVPFGAGSALDVVLVQTVEKMRKERAKAFFDELARGELVLDENLLKDDEFLHAYFSTASYALNSKRKEKIEMFARLLKSSQISDGPTDLDQYEDFLKILDELSFRELKALAIFDGFSDRPRQADYNDLQWVNTFWDEFEARASHELRLSSEEVGNFMNRIARTGCFEMFTGNFIGYTGGRGKLTPTYRTLKQYIAMGDTGRDINFEVHN